MSWHSTTILPKEGDRLLVHFKGCEEGNYFKMTVREGESFNHIKKWCYLDDYNFSLQRKLERE